MKIRINNRIVDMSLRCFKFSPTAKENTKYISDKEFNDIENDFLSQSSGAVQSVRSADTRSSADSCSSQSAGAVQSVRGADTPPVGQKPHKAADRHC